MPDLNPLGNGHSESIYMAPQFCYFPVAFFGLCGFVYSLPVAGEARVRGFALLLELWHLRMLPHLSSIMPLFC